MYTIQGSLISIYEHCSYFLYCLLFLSIAILSHIPLGLVGVSIDSSHYCHFRRVLLDTRCKRCGGGDYGGQKRAHLIQGHLHENETPASSWRNYVLVGDCFFAAFSFFGFALLCMGTCLLFYVHSRGKGFSDPLRRTIQRIQRENGIHHPQKETLIGPCWKNSSAKSFQTL